MKTAVKFPDHGIAAAGQAPADGPADGPANSDIYRERVIQIALDHSGTLYTLTSEGRLFARVRDTAATMNQRNQDQWLWRELRGPPPS